MKKLVTEVIGRACTLYKRMVFSKLNSDEEVKNKVLYLAKNLELDSKNSVLFTSLKQEGDTMKLLASLFALLCIDYLTEIPNTSYEHEKLYNDLLLVLYDLQDKTRRPSEVLVLLDALKSNIYTIYTNLTDRT